MAIDTLVERTEIYKITRIVKSTRFTHEAFTIDEWLFYIPLHKL